MDESLDLASKKSPAFRTFLTTVQQPDAALVRGTNEQVLPSTLSEDARRRASELITLIMQGDALAGNLFVHAGKSLHELRTILQGHRTADGVDAWKSYCETQGYTSNYVSRMVQVGRIFSDLDIDISNLSFRHLREVARISREPSELENLLLFLKNNALNIHHTRLLVSRVNRGTIKLEDIKADLSYPEEWKQDIQSELSTARGHHERLEGALGRATEKLASLQADGSPLKQLEAILSSLGSPEAFSARLRQLGRPTTSDRMERLLGELSNWADEVQDRLSSETNEAPNWG